RWERGSWWGWGHWWEWGDGGAGFVVGWGRWWGRCCPRSHSSPRPRWSAETTLERRDHAGVLAAAAPKTACSVETTLACRDHGAGTVVSARRSGFDAAGRPSASRQVTGASQSKG